MKDKIEKIRQELTGDNKKRQDYIVFSEKERLSILEATKKLGLPKPMTIAVACRFLVESLSEEEKTEKKTNGKSS